MYVQIDMWVKVTEMLNNSECCMRGFMPGHVWWKDTLVEVETALLSFLSKYEVLKECYYYY